MKRLLLIALALVIAGVAVAEDEFGLWRMVDGEYTNMLPVDEIPGPFTLYVTLHDGTSFSVGGYEVGMDLPAEMFVLEVDFLGGTNFGGNDNHLVGYPIPKFVMPDEPLVLSVMSCLSSAPPAVPTFIRYHGSTPNSIPGHDGPVYADGAQPDILIACGYITGSQDVFLFGGQVATEAHSLSDVKSLFE